MTPDWLAWPETQTLIHIFEATRAELRFVGGAVRDSLLGREVTEVDVATPLKPDSVTALLEAAGVRVIPTGIAHGTVTALIGERSFEITTLRKDVSTDGRHAEVEFTDDWKEDASRRDFTMNALYLAPDGSMLDFFSGGMDAAAGHVRFIGDNDQRIREDYLRILRFFRFHAHYGKGEADDAALKACKANRGGLQSLSGERIQSEMLKLLAAHDAWQTVKLMKENGILIFPKGINFERLKQLEHLRPDSAPALKLAALIAAPDVEPLAGRWKLSNDMKKYLGAVLSSLPENAPTLAEQKALLRNKGKDIFADIAYLSAAGGAWGAPESALELADSWDIPVFPISGEDIKKELGMPEGKALGEALARLEEAWEKSDYTLTREDLLAPMRTAP